MHLNPDMFNDKIKLKKLHICGHQMGLLEHFIMGLPKRMVLLSAVLLFFH